MKPKRRNDGLVVQELPDEVLIYDLERNKAVCLGRRLALIWRYCTGRRTVKQIADAVSKDSGEALGEDIVRLGLHRISKARLLEQQVDVPRAAQPSRRNLLRLAATLGGLSVLAITAPTALQAATCLRSGSCVNNQCRDAAGNRCCGGCSGSGRTCGNGPGMTFVCD